MIRAGAACAFLWCLMAGQLNGQATTDISVPDLIGPIPGHIFFATAQDLAAHGYTEEEFFLEGAARQYDLTTSSRPRALNGLYPYKTRIIVRRPVDDSRFNGTVIVEWLNVTVGFDIDIDWILAREHILRSGFAWIGVSAQRAGLDGLRDWNAQRYGTLDLTADSMLLEDELAYDVFSQAVAAIRNAEHVRVLGPLVPEVVIATGHSQSASRLSVYHDRIQPISNLIDGFVIHGGGQPLDEDVGTRVFKINAETDLWAMQQASRRQNDSDALRTWEVAGSSHVDEYYMTHLAELQRRDFGAALTLDCDHPPLSRIPFRYVLSAVYDHLDAWIREGTAPPRAPPLEVASVEPEIRLARDEFGNALGGIRLPHHAVPVAMNSGRNSGGRFCRFYGTHEPFDRATLARLYPTPDVYTDAFSAAVRANLRSGYILEGDTARMIEEAAGRHVGRR